ncbi:MAG: hypothetical protein C0598_07055, partial [Marinilabiliales bacterium]
YKERISCFKKNPNFKILLLPVIYYLLLAISLIYSQNLEEGLFTLEKKLTLLILPLFVGTETNFFKDITSKGLGTKLVNAFILGVLIIVILNYGYAFYRYLNGSGTEAFYRNFLARWNHPSYVSMYASLALMILLHRLLFLKDEIFINKYFQVFIILVLVVYLFMLSQRGPLLSWMMLLPIYAAYILINKKETRLAIVFTIICILVVLFSYQFIGLVKNRVDNTLEQVNNEFEQKKAPLTNRIVIWKVSLETIKNEMLLGYGVGDVKDALNPVYLERKRLDAVEHNLNAHNQYLQTCIEIGILGLLYFVLMLLLITKFAWQNNKLILLIFLFLFVANILFEVMLDRASGVIGFAYLFSVLTIRTKNVGAVN